MVNSKIFKAFTFVGGCVIWRIERGVKAKRQRIKEIARFFKPFKDFTIDHSPLIIDHDEV